MRGPLEGDWLISSRALGENFPSSMASIIYGMQVACHDFSRVDFAHVRR